uniref:Uncharacterized protein n=1 Tax=Trypanosoma congolense (strain IL3000) TaxID=1068625 RepID=F9W5N1_TRYCI|nr:hypothetical protein, unlikely [Trypanosoma congolense IL3000]
MNTVHNPLNKNICGHWCRSAFPIPRDAVATIIVVHYPRYLIIFLSRSKGSMPFASWTSAWECAFCPHNNSTARLNVHPMLKEVNHHTEQGMICSTSLVETRVDCVTSVSDLTNNKKNKKRARNMTPPLGVFPGKIMPSKTHSFLT